MKHLTFHERELIMIYLSRGLSIREIARRIGRSFETVRREIIRNSYKKPHFPQYSASHAQHKAYSRSLYRKKDISKVRSIPNFENFMRSRLASWRSPQKIALARNAQNPHHTISFKSIYNFLHSPLGKKLLASFDKPLIKKYTKRKKTQNAKNIPHRIHISLRPLSFQYQFWHREADTFFGTNSLSHPVLILTEKLSRFSVLFKLPNKKSSTTFSFLRLFAQNFPVASITFDNGSEFAKHHLLRNFNINTFFTTPWKPTDKPQVENAIWRVRYFLPKSYDFKKLSQHSVEIVSNMINNIPLLVLDMKTPAQVFLYYKNLFKNQLTAFGVQSAI